MTTTTARSCERVHTQNDLSSPKRPLTASSLPLRPSSMPTSRYLTMLKPTAAIPSGHPPAVKRCVSNGWLSFFASASASFEQPAKCAEPFTRMNIPVAKSTSHILGFSKTLGSGPFAVHCTACTRPGAIQAWTFWTYISSLLIHWHRCCRISIISY